MWKFHARAYIGRGQKFVACRTSASLEATVRRAPIRSLPSRGSNIRALIMFGGLTPTAVDLAWIKFTSLSSVVSGLKLPIYRTDLFGPGFCLEIRDHDSSSDGIGSTHIRFSLFSPALRSDGVTALSSTLSVLASFFFIFFLYFFYLFFLPLFFVVLSSRFHYLHLLSNKFSLSSNVTSGGTYLVKNVRARFEYRKTIAAHEKQVKRQEEAQTCARWWRKTRGPKRVSFLAIDAPIVD